MFGYLTTEKFLPELLEELKNVRSVHRAWFSLMGPCREFCMGPKSGSTPSIPFESIGQAAKHLKSRGKLSAPYSFDNHRRSQLIQDQLPRTKPRVLEFLAPLPEMNLGAWTLADKNTLIASSQTNSVFPLGK